MESTKQAENVILYVIDDVIAYITSNKKLNQAVTELFIRGKKLNISIAFITHFLLWKFQTNERFIKSQWYKSKDFINIYKETTAKPFHFFSEWH